MAHALCVVLSAVCLYGLAWIGFLVLRGPLILPSWLAGADAVAYLKADASSEEGQRVLDELRTWPEIEAMRFVSKEEARRRLEKRLGGWKGILSGIGPEFLQPSIEVTFVKSLKAPEHKAKAIDRMRLVSNVVEILYGNGEGDTVRSISRWIERGGWILTAFLALLFTCTHWAETFLRACGSPGELAALEWLGAPDWLVRLPSLLASWMTGIVAAILAIAFFALTVHHLGAVLPLQFAALFSVDAGEWLLLGLGMIGGSLGMGSLGVYVGLGHVRRLCSNGQCS
jgi:cell division transport system permease protein